MASSRPSISLALIAKNEEKNIRRLLDSVKDCFDEIVLVDTGSTDKTKEIAKEYGCKTYDFEWVNSFSKARNFSFSKCTSDYIMWMDLDDVLSDRDAFIKWRDNAMAFSGAWFCTYNYALDKQGKPIVSFVRERVFKRELNPIWNYDIHEGIVIKPEWSPNYAVSWKVNHMRDLEDIQQDKLRNISILENAEKDSRLQFYYGKELYEAGRPYEAIREFKKALKMKQEDHDRVLALQYAAYSAMTCFDKTKDEFKEDKENYFKEAIDFCIEGLKVDPNRAEFHVAMGDMFIKKGMLRNAIPYFAAAKSCFNPKANGLSAYEGAVYSFLNCYGELPSLQLSRIYLHTGDLDKALKEAKECYELYKNEEAKKVIVEAERIKKLTTIDNNQIETDDIVFTCPPQQAYEFDEQIYKTKGMGGSETALIEMARLLKQKTNKKVIVFNSRKEDLISESGVEYISNTKLGEYFSNYKPRTHIAWRHNIKLTKARTYLWGHDLITPSVESYQNFDKMLCLSEFHKDYTMAMQGLSPEKIIVTRNGINPEKFKFERKPKNPNKIVFMSSPDRGLGRCMLICDELKKYHPDIELHVYYGIENLEKYGRKQLADHLKQMISERPYVKYHGFTEQNRMYRDISDAVLWLHPATFIETSCITAMEMPCLGVFTITRKLGALPYTLAEAEKNGMAVLFDHGRETIDNDGLKLSENELQDYVDAASAVFTNQLWNNVKVDPDSLSWSKVADEWIKFMEL